MELKKMTVEGFVQETSSSSPAPGGGSIAALKKVPRTTGAAFLKSGSPTSARHLTLLFCSAQPDQTDMISFCFSSTAASMFLIYLSVSF